MISTAAQAQPINEILVPIKGTEACWQRDYTDSHLAAHPRQKVTSIRLGLSYYETEHDAPGQGSHAFSIDVTTRERSGSEGGLCHMDDNGRAICAIECDGGAISLRHSGAEGSLLLGLESGGLRLEECGIDNPFWLSAEPDDKVFLVHPVDCQASAE